MTHPLIEKYGDPVPLLTSEPQSATDLYYLWADTPEWKSLNRRRRNERRWLGRHLQHLANEGAIQHGTVTTEHGGEWRGFWVDTTDTAGHRPGVPQEDAGVPPVGRVGQSVR
jgi:hypothetical protein